MPHRNAALVLAACVAAVPASAQAAGGPSKLLYEREFLVSFSAESRTTMDIPKHYGSSDCSGRPWSATHGEEVWKIKARRAVRMGMTILGNGSATFIRSDVDDAYAGIPSAGSIERDVETTAGVEPGTCGAGQPEGVLPGLDCGTKRQGYEVGLQLVAGQLGISPSTSYGNKDEDHDAFVDCPIQRAFTQSGSSFWSNAAARVSVKRLSTVKHTLIVRGSRTKTQKLHDAPKAKTTTSTKVIIRLKPLAPDSRRP